MSVWSSSLESETTDSFPSPEPDGSKLNQSPESSIPSWFNSTGSMIETSFEKWSLLPVPNDPRVKFIANIPLEINLPSAIKSPDSLNSFTRLLSKITLTFFLTTWLSDNNENFKDGTNITFSILTDFPWQRTSTVPQPNEGRTSPDAVLTVSSQSTRLLNHSLWGHMWSEAPLSASHELDLTPSDLTIERTTASSDTFLSFDFRYLKQSLFRCPCCLQ